MQCKSDVLITKTTKLTKMTKMTKMNKSKVKKRHNIFEAQAEAENDISSNYAKIDYKQWNLQPHIYAKQIKLDGTYERIPISPKIQIPLYEPQKIALAAMIRLEQVQEIRLLSQNKVDVLHRICKTNTGILSNPLGSGKTLTILALIATVPLPPARPFKIQYSVLDDFCYSKRKKIPYVQNHNVCIRKRVDKIIRPALIFTGRPALKQWLYAVETQTILRVFVIENVRCLRDFKNMINDGTINQYDVIIVKSGPIGNGKIFSTIFTDITIETINSYSSTEFYSVISNLTRNLCFSRLVIDDFDQICLPKVMGEINALFTWYVSSTAVYKSNAVLNHKYTLLNTHKQTIRHKSYDDDDVSIESLLYRSYTTLINIYSSKVLFSNFNICCTDDLIKETIHIGKPMCYVYSVKNPDDQLIAALGSIGSKKITEIFEMLNGDAINEAAIKAGISAVSTKDIFQKILDDSYELWNKSRQILRFIIVERLPIAHSNRLSITLNPNKSDYYGKIDLRVLRPIKYNYPTLNTIFNEEHYYWSAIKAENGKSIERIQNNLQANVCAICGMTLTHSICEDDNEEDEDDDINSFMAELIDVSDDESTESKSIIMMKCCGITLCAECGIRGSNFRRTTYYKHKRYTNEIIVGLCANCKCNIVFNDLIFINKDFNHDRIIMEEINEEDEEEEKEDIPIEKKPNNKPRTKLDILIDIINGIKPREQKHLDKQIPNLMIGTANLPIAPKKDIKVLIFSNFEETLANVKKRLDSEKINYEKLAGTANNIHQMSVQFNTSTDLNILLVNSVKYCASLNLQMATDCVFMHKILDKSIESQVSGRAQRIGRKYNLRIHFLAYENELQYI